MTDGLPADEPIELTVEARAHGWRVDHYLTRLYPNYSRALFQQAIDQGRVLVNGLPTKRSRRLRVNDRMSVRLPQQPDLHLPPEDIPLTIVYEDDAIVVINKAAGMIVHPGKGNYRGTLAGALQFHFDELSDMAGQQRPGIVHRLDRNTSGVMIVAKNNQVHHRLSSQFERREVTKEYRAIVWGNVPLESDYIETYVRVHPGKRERMLVCEAGGNARQATTFYQVLERLRASPIWPCFPRRDAPISCACICSTWDIRLSPTDCTAAARSSVLPISPPLEIRTICLTSTVCSSRGRRFTRSG